MNGKEINLKKDPSKIDMSLPLKGRQVIIRANQYNLRNIDIVGVIEGEPESWIKIKVRYFDPFTGDLDDKGFPVGDFVVKDFIATHLEIPTQDVCLKLAHHYKRLALELNELRKQLV